MKILYMLLISRSESSDIKDIIPFLINDNDKNNYNNDINKDKEKFSMRKYINNSKKPKYDKNNKDENILILERLCKTFTIILIDEKATIWVPLNIQKSQLHSTSSPNSIKEFSLLIIKFLSFFDFEFN